MKKILFILALVLGTQCFAQVNLGLRDTRYAQLGYTYKDRWSATLEHSIYSEHFDNQKVRLYLGYHNTWNWFTLNVQPYASTLWNGNYQDVGTLLNVDLRVLHRWHVDATINPHYDTQIGYSTCYSAGTKVTVTEQVAIVAHFTNIPEYRESEKRIRAGLEFKVLNLIVTPELSVPVEGQQKTIRALCGFNYKIGKK